MVTRRLFTISLVVAPFATWLGCGGSSDDGEAGDGITSTTSPTIPCDGVAARSSLDAGHTHDVCVRATDMSSAPAAGATYTMTTDDGHTHRITLDAAQLAALGRGDVVRVTTTNDAGHVHMFSLARAGTVSPPEQPGPPTGPY